MTSLALIPPLTHLELGSTRMHLLLAHMCRDQSYVKFYRQKHIQGDYLILDNSAYELGEAERTMANLMALGYYLQVDEIVAPDVITNERDTYGHMLDSVSFMASTVGQYAWKRAGSPRIMVVPQVDPAIQSIAAWERHARLLMELWHFTCPYLMGHITIAVSKNMDKLTGGWLLIFREVVSELIKEYPLQVHVLGLPHRLNMVRQVLKANPYIRSIDTATPFIQAMHNQTMQVPDDQLVARPDNYNEYVFTDEQIELAKQNVDWMFEYYIRPGESVAPRAVTDAERHTFLSRSKQ